MKIQKHKADIIIEIPDDLNAKQEWDAIATEIALQTKCFAPAQHMLVGNVDVPLDSKKSETHIVVKRIQSASAIKTLQCNVCNCDFDASMAKYAYTNYGGKVRKLCYCSDDCRNIALSIGSAGRIAVRKKDLKPFALFERRLSTY